MPRGRMSLDRLASDRISLYSVSTSCGTSALDFAVLRTTGLTWRRTIRRVGLHDLLEAVDSHVDLAPTCSTASTSSDAFISAPLGVTTGSRRVCTPEMGGALNGWLAGAVRLLADIIEGHICQYISVFLNARQVRQRPSVVSFHIFEGPIS
jgi:hypothetical protein